MSRYLTPLVLGLALLFGAAHGAAAQSGEAEALGLRMSRALFQVLPIANLVEKAVADDKSGFEVASRPEWKGYLSEAMAEELHHDLPALERLVGLSLAKSFTLDELKVGAVLFEDPGMKAAMSGSSKTGKPSRETERLMRTPAGASLLEKMGDVDALLTPVFDEFIVELLPGAFRRFADKAEAGEARRAAASPP